MGLRTKLFLWIGSLIFFLALLMFIFPKYFIERDVAQATVHVKELIQQESVEIQNNLQTLFEEKIHESIRDVEALLLLVNEFQNLPEKEGRLWWEVAARLLTYNPDIGFVQIHDTRDQKTEGIVAFNAPLYAVKIVSSLSNGLAIIALKPLRGSVEPQSYLGIPLKESSSAKFFYVLIHLDERVLTEMKKTEILQSDSFDPTSWEQGVYWANKVELITLLAPLYGKGVRVLEKDPLHIPEGVASVDAAGRGIGVLSQNLFRTQPVFDDEKYYASYQPLSGPPLGNSSAVILDAQSGLLFLGNTLFVKGVYFTLGIPFDQIVKQIALASNRSIVFSYEGSYWRGFTAKGEKFDEAELSTLNAQNDVITIGKTSYFYNRITPLPHQTLSFYALTPREKEASILNTLYKLDQDLTAKISSQMLVMMILAILVSLIVLTRIALKITRPIIKLAQATEKVSNGTYESIDLPEMGNRKDEIAILSKSFEEMVHGLEEREKIRGVLNKVVSKDVADEILKTNIHLGGEDRIVTILFSDIRDFTKLTENMPPQKIITMLNKYMTKMSRVIEGEGGVIDKYVGDEIMALYGAPTPHPDHAIRALSAAKLMIETLKRWNEERRAQGESIIEAGIGIHTGVVVAGNMGAEDRLNYTVLGANVNLAARLCQVAKPMQVIISEHTLAEPGIKESFHVTPLEPIHLKGFSESINIYEITGFKWV